MNNQLHTECHGLPLWFEEFLACTTSFQPVQQLPVSRVGIFQKTFRLSHTLSFQTLGETLILFFKRNRPTGKFLKYIGGKGNMLPWCFQNLTYIVLGLHTAVTMNLFTSKNHFKAYTICFSFIALKI